MDEEGIDPYKSRGSGSAFLLGGIGMDGEDFLF